MKLDQITQGHIQSNFEYPQGLLGFMEPFPSALALPGVSVSLNIPLLGASALKPPSCGAGLLCSRMHQLFLNISGFLTPGDGKDRTQLSSHILSWVSLAQPQLSPLQVLTANPGGHSAVTPRDELRVRGLFVSPAEGRAPTRRRATPQHPTVIPPAQPATHISEERLHFAKPG